MLVRKARPLPVECIVRGYISGSGWKDYQKTGAICGVRLPEGLTESAKLEEPIFTPSTKAELGEHDENISFDQCVALVGQETAEKIRDVTIAIYKRARNIAVTKGIIIDECMTPDSSRFWPCDSYRPGGAQPSFDKQFLRDYLETLDWGKCTPPPPLPDEIVRKTGEKYMEALVRLTGKK